MSDFYCAAPWRGLHINPRGDVKTCCSGDPNMLGNLNHLSITEILHSPMMQEIRETIKSGRLHERYCSNCIKAEQYGRSERKWHNDVNYDFDISQAQDLEHVPTLIDVRWNTTCNLSCNYCGETCSSRWADLKGIPFKSGARPYYESVCKYLEQHQNSIREVALVGGEPLLLTENERLLDVIPASATITLITNLNVNLETNKVFQKLKNRTRVGWSMSFDNIGKRFEYVRFGSNFDLLKKNLQIVQNLMATNGHYGGIHAVYNIYNATRLCEFKEFANEHNLSIVWQTLFWPEQLNPFLHGPQVAELAVAEIEKLYSSGLATETDRLFFDKALEAYRNPNNNNVSLIQSKFAQHTEDIEGKYHTASLGQFSLLWPELATK